MARETYVESKARQGLVKSPSSFDTPRQRQIKRRAASRLGQTPPGWLGLGLGVPMWKARPVWPASQEISANWPRLAEAGRGWPRLEAALRLIWRWRGVSKLEGKLAEASGRLLFTQQGSSRTACRVNLPP